MNLANTIIITTAIFMPAISTLKRVLSDMKNMTQLVFAGGGYATIDISLNKVNEWWKKAKDVQAEGIRRNLRMEAEEVKWEEEYERELLKDIQKN